MASYVQLLVQSIEPLDDKVILVGHNLVGAVISQTAERIPKKGDSILEAMKRDPGGEFCLN